MRYWLTFSTLQFSLLFITAQNFLSFIQPFLGSGLDSVGGAGNSGAGSALGAGGAGPAGPAGGAGGNAAAIQAITSMFGGAGGAGSGDEYGNNPFGDFVNLGQAIAEASKKKPKRSTDEYLAEYYLKYSDPPKAKAKPKAKPKAKAKKPGPKKNRRGRNSRNVREIKYDGHSRLANSGRSKRQANPFQLLTALAPRQSGAPVGRLTDRFGKNFFKFLDELHEYSQLLPDASTPSSTTPPPLFPTLFPTPPPPGQTPPPFTLLPPPGQTPPPFTLLPPPGQTPPPFTLLPPPGQSPAPFTLLPPPPTPPPPTPLVTVKAEGVPVFPVVGEQNIIASDVGLQDPQSKDLLDANNLMRGFLNSMAKLGSKPARQYRPLKAMNDGTEAGRNRPLMDQLFESDILLTSKQIKA
ncbi:unnamed protein product [Bursaphelenchus xylophilus]|uniref:(pine wood nematode) hypothetical protein n=1 Tax=Bursaphelenchus xylophilus TaxID=6326 RepID=A0A1I7S1J3_BURXY|nr:unnamed protein product [Bursaphelenchus xylophilus]CAG9081411.1 unnamed protein product [Bursaphelenchus xylophilus]